MKVNNYCILRITEWKKEDVIVETENSLVCNQPEGNLGDIYFD